jgi:hypothetical protein
VSDKNPYWLERDWGEIIHIYYFIEGRVAGVAGGRKVGEKL